MARGFRKAAKAEPVLQVDENGNYVTPETIKQDEEKATKFDADAMYKKLREEYDKEHPLPVPPAFQQASRVSEEEHDQKLQEYEQAALEEAKKKNATQKQNDEAEKGYANVEEAIDAVEFFFGQNFVPVIDESDIPPSPDEYVAEPVDTPENYDWDNDPKYQQYREATDNVPWDDNPPEEFNFGDVPVSSDLMPESSAYNPVPNAKSNDDSIMITADMLEEKPIRHTYTVKEEYLEELLKKAFERLDIPEIEVLKGGSDFVIEAGGNEPADLYVVGKDGTDIKVPLGEHEQESLDNSIEEYEQTKGKDR